MFNKSFQQSSIAIFVCRWDRMNQSNTPSLLQRNCLWFSKGPSKICGQSGKQISIQLLWVKRELGELPGTDVRKKRSQKVMCSSTPACPYKMGFGHRYVQSFTPVNSNTLPWTFELDAQSCADSQEMLHWSVPVYAANIMQSNLLPSHGGKPTQERAPDTWFTLKHVSAGKQLYEGLLCCTSGVTSLSATLCSLMRSSINVY